MSISPGLKTSSALLRLQAGPLNPATCALASSGFLHQQRLTMCFFRTSSPQPHTPATASLLATGVDVHQAAYVELAHDCLLIFCVLCAGGKKARCVLSCILCCWYCFWCGGDWIVFHVLLRIF
jgi:hypothetical protein